MRMMIMMMMTTTTTTRRRRRMETWWSEKEEIVHCLFNLFIILIFDITVFNATLFDSFYSSTTCFGHTGPSSGTIAIVAKAVSLLFCFYFFLYTYYFICIMHFLTFCFTLKEKSETVHRWDSFSNNSNSTWWWPSVAETCCTRIQTDE
jgi:hypothetical protein